ncbi:MAG TPA: response regulator transcription factor [Acidimicrobiales bacterium]|nr:response regulator transcription factor [Acidimicrobiales bacterium]
MPTHQATRPPVRVVLVNDEQIIVDGLHTMLARHRDQVKVVGRVLATDDLAKTLPELDADVVLVDLHIQGASGLELAARLLADDPPFRLVIFTDDTEERRLFEALRLGASGYLLKSLSGIQLADHLVRVAEGQVVVDPTIATRIALRGAQFGGAEMWPGSDLSLSQRESQVLALLVEGLSNRLIAAQLVVGEETVKTHLRSIYRKLGVNDRSHAVATVMRLGIFG